MFFCKTLNLTMEPKKKNKKIINSNCHKLIKKLFEINRESRSHGDIETIFIILSFSQRMKAHIKSSIDAKQPTVNDTKLEHRNH